MNTWDELIELCNGFDTPYEYFVQCECIKHGETCKAVEDWFNQRGYQYTNELADADLESGIYIMVGYELFKCVDNPIDNQLWWRPEESGAVLFDFDSLAYTGYPKCQFIWDKEEEELYLMKVS